MTEEDAKNTWNDLARYVKRKAKSKTDDKIKKALEKQSSDDPNAEEEIKDGDDYLSDDELKFDNIKTKEKKQKKRKLTEENEEFFEEIATNEEATTFYQMNLSRPLMKAISAMSFIHPTPIQASTIPNALLGK